MAQRHIYAQQISPKLGTSSSGIVTVNFTLMTLPSWRRMKTKHPTTVGTLAMMLAN
jgi:hypothetical protein